MMWDLRDNRDMPPVPGVERPRERRISHDRGRSHERRPSRERGFVMPSPRFADGQPSAGTIPFPQPQIPIGVAAGPSMHSSHSGHRGDSRGPTPIPRSATPYIYRESSVPRAAAPAPSQPRPRAHSLSTGNHNATTTTHSRHTHRHTHSHSHSRPQQHVVFQTTAPVQAPTPAVSRSARVSHSQGNLRAQAPVVHHTQPMFQYSKCTGRKKAVCVGINYTGQPHELKGCINDARSVRSFLIQHYGYKSGDIVLLTDDTSNSRRLPTKRNITDAMRWLVDGAQKHDSLFFHYSGHGGQTPDLDGDETDGYDEVIFPLDFQKRGHLVDDEMHDLMVKPLPIGCRLTALFDSCHSGTVLDLPYIYHTNGRLKGQHVTARARETKGTRADVISWCGCKDDQTSADTYSGGVAVGAMSNAFITALRDNRNQTYKELLRSVRDILRQRYSQKPQLSSSHPIDIGLKFII